METTGERQRGGKHRESDEEAAAALLTGTQCSYCGGPGYMESCEHMLKVNPSTLSFKVQLLLTSP